MSDNKKGKCPTHKTAVRFPEGHWIFDLPQGKRSAVIRETLDSHEEIKRELAQLRRDMAEIKAMLQQGYAPGPAAPPSEPETDTETKTGEKKVKTDSVLKSSISDFMDF